MELTQPDPPRRTGKRKRVIRDDYDAAGDEEDEEDEQEQSKTVSPPPKKKTRRAALTRKSSRQSTEDADDYVSVADVVEDDQDQDKSASPVRKRKRNPAGGSKKTLDDVFDLSIEKVPPYPKREYILSDKYKMIYGKVHVPQSKDSAKPPFDYSAVTFKREDETTKRKKGGPKTWTFSLPARLNKELQEASTRAMIAAGLTPYTG